MDKLMINHRQMAWLIGVVLLAGGLISLFKVLVKVAHVDAWFSEVGAVCYAFFIVYCMYRLSKRYPGKHIFQISQEVAGKFGGGLINVLFLLHFWIALIRDLGVLGDFMNTTLLRRTPQEIVLYAFVLVLIYYGKTSLEVTARVNDLVFPLIIFIIFLIPIALANEFSFERMQPFLGQGAMPLIWSSTLSAGWFADVVVAGAFLHTLLHARQFHASARHGIIFAAVALTLLIFMCISVLGPGITENSIYPSYLLVEQIHITDFLDRVELVLFSVWLPAFFCKVSFLFLAFTIGISSFSKRKDYSLYTRQAGWFVLLGALTGFKGITEVFAFGNIGVPILTLAYQVPTLLLLLVLAKVRGNKKKEEHQDREFLEARERFEKQENLSRLQKVRSTTWMWMTNGLLATCLAALTVGIYFGPEYKWLGLGPGLLVLFCLVACLFTSYMEMHKINLLIQTKSKEAKRRQGQKTA